LLEALGANKKRGCIDPKKWTKLTKLSSCGAAMRTFNIHHAKTHLSRLVDEAAGGEPFIIAKAGKPMAQVIPIRMATDKPKRRIGFMKGMYTLPRNFKRIDKQLDKEIEMLFLGESRKLTKGRR
jgi:prevent-host-death family protein